MSAPIEVLGFEARSGLAVVPASCGGVLQDSDSEQPARGAGINGWGISLTSTAAGQVETPDIVYGALPHCV